MEKEKGEGGEDEERKMRRRKERKMEEGDREMSVYVIERNREFVQAILSI